MNSLMAIDTHLSEGVASLGRKAEGRPTIHRFIG
jgi:hypothetical protein